MNKKQEKMEIEGLDYNTQREPLKLPIYGREIQRMVDFTTMLPTKELRQRGANTIIGYMALKQPQMATEDKGRILWDHLYMMGKNKLDIDWPYDMEGAEKILDKPVPLKLKGSEDHVKLRHYGRLLETLFKKLEEMEEGEEKDELVRVTANQMKRCLVDWGRGSTDDGKVAEDLRYYTHGAVELDLNTFKFDKLSVGSAQKAKQQKKKKK